MEWDNKLQPKVKKVAPQNKGSYQGKPFWIGTVNTLDGKIESVYDYETAESNDFHHSFYMSPEIVEKIDNEDSAVFWFNNNGEIEFQWRNDIAKDWLEAIKEQLDK